MLLSFFVVPLDDATGLNFGLNFQVSDVVVCGGHVSCLCCVLCSEDDDGVGVNPGQVTLASIFVHFMVDLSVCLSFCVCLCLYVRMSVYYMSFIVF